MPKSPTVSPKSGSAHAQRQCECGAVNFQGPFERGTFVDDNFVVSERVYQCRGCHKEYTLEQVLALAERVVP